MNKHLLRCMKNYAIGTFLYFATKRVENIKDLDSDNLMKILPFSAYVIETATYLWHRE